MRSNLKRELLGLMDELVVDERGRARPLTDLEKARKRFVSAGINLYQAIKQEESGGGKKEEKMPILSQKSR